MPKFINPFTDVGFKRIFGQEFSKPVLLTFLNSLLEGERQIVDVQYLDKEKLRLSGDNRSLIYDILCRTATGEYVIVEMQNRSQPFFKNRCVFYLSRAIVEQGEQGSQWEYDIKAVYLIAFMNFRLEGFPEHFRTDVALMDMERKALFSDKERLILLQLPYFTKDVDECEDIFERIIYVLKHMDILKRMPFLAQDAVFKRLSEIAEVGSLSKDERREYDESLKHYRDTIAVMHGQFLEGLGKGIEQGRAEGEAKGRKEGEAKGRAEGRAEGRKDERLAIARGMKASGMHVDMIAKYTGLTAEEIDGL